MTDKPFDPTKPVQTRDGREVKLFLDYLGTDQYPILGAIKRADGRWRSRSWASDGRASVWDDKSVYALDLVNVPERRSGWINIYSKEELQATKDEAERVAVGNRIACIYVEFKEGEGLNND